MSNPEGGYFRFPSNPPTHPKHELTCSAVTRGDWKRGGGVRAAAAIPRAPPPNHDTKATVSREEGRPATRLRLRLLRLALRTMPPQPPAKATLVVAIGALLCVVGGEW